MSDVLDEARDVAQQAVTAALTYDRETAGEIIREFGNDLALALVLVDLVAYTHHSWCRSIGFDDQQRLASWQALMIDVAEFRLDQGVKE